jgi:hypothetical protein
MSDPTAARDWILRTVPANYREDAEQAIADLLAEREMAGFVHVPQEVRDRATALIHNTLFAEDDNDGPIFRWSEQRLAHDDDTLLKCAADMVVNDLVAHPEVLAELLLVALNQQQIRDGE